MRSAIDLSESQWRSQGFTHLGSADSPELQIFHYPNRLDWFTSTRSIDERRDLVVAGSASPHNGLVWIHGGYVLGDSYGSLNRATGWGLAMHVSLGRRPPPLTSADPVLCIPSWPYFHFLLEFAPAALRATESLGPVTFVIGPEAPPYAYEFLDHLMAARQGANDRVEVRGAPFSHPKVVVAAVQPVTGWFSSSDIARLSAFGISVTSQSEDRTQLPRRIFISRRGATRVLPFEASLSTMLQAEGFQTITLDDLSLADQVRVLQGAEVVVASHGAGLANVVFSETGTAVIELHQTDRPNDCFARLCALKGHRYVPVEVAEAAVTLRAVELAVREALDGLVQPGRCDVWPHSITLAGGGLRP